MTQPIKPAVVVELKPKQSSPNIHSNPEHAKKWWEYAWTYYQNFAKEVWMLTDESYEELSDQPVDWDDLSTIDIATWNLYSVAIALLAMPKNQPKLYQKSLEELGGNHGELVLRCMRDPESRMPHCWAKD